MLKKHFKTLIALFLIITLCLAFCITVKATDVEEVTTTQEENKEALPEVTSEAPTKAESKEDDIIRKDLYIFEESAVMDKIVDGNLYVFGNNIKITGKVNGNAFVFGNEISFEAPSSENNSDDYCYVAGSVFVFGNKVKFDGVAQDIYAFGTNFELTYNSYIMRDIKIAGQNVTLKGYITRNADVLAENINLGIANDENEAEDDSVMIGGDFNYSASKEIQIPENRILGEVKFTEFDTPSSDEVKVKNAFDVIFEYIKDLSQAIIYTLVMYFVIIFISPKFFEQTSKLLKEKVGATIGAGAIVTLAIPMALILLCILFFKLGLAVSLIWSIMVFALSSTITAGSLTYLLKDKFGFDNKKWLLLIIITIILWALQQIPLFIGFIVYTAINIVGSGLLVKNILEYRKSINSANN